MCQQDKSKKEHSQGLLEPLLKLTLGEYLE